ncbi:hypothetical protein [Nocardioides sp. AE5]|uniref:hypothetical protein n=1 Tax=Nocardioides sp. AE5 TaxID=2962573 RepID=UPI00288180C7|nr:hypothetical protein [Nocardioides sp. AE5]MDT0202142.1 hypothetical protein [Nocardioides sp. AE5]
MEPEKPGWALGVAGAGSLVALVGLFLPWFSVWREHSSIGREDEASAGIFSAVDVVTHVTDGARLAPEGGPSPISSCR